MSETTIKNDLFLAALEASPLTYDQISVAAKIGKKTIYNLINHPDQNVRQRVKDSLCQVLGKTAPELGWSDD